jgi:hypothetical protein
MKLLLFVTTSTNNGGVGIDRLSVDLVKVCARSFFLHAANAKRSRTARATSHQNASQNQSFPGVLAATPTLP